MKIYLAGVAPWRGGQEKKTIMEHRPYILESFYYTDEDTERLLPYFGDFLLDSGAFTFMQSSKNHVDWEEYIEKYASFINRNKIDKYFELDIDNIVGFMISAIKNDYTVSASSGNNRNKNSFNSFKQRKYDYAELERAAVY